MGLVIFYLHLLAFWMVNVGKYTIHGCYGFVLWFTPPFFTAICHENIFGSLFPSASSTSKSMMPDSIRELFIPYLEDHPGYRKWLGSPPFIRDLGHLEGEQPYLGGTYQPWLWTTYWDDPPSIWRSLSLWKGHLTIPKRSPAELPGNCFPTMTLLLYYLPTTVFIYSHL